MRLHFREMTNPSDKPRAATGDNIERDAETLEDKFGDLAKIYAENRSEAAQLRGAGRAAQHWQKVEKEIDGEDDAD